uniref:Tubulin-specific chaperone cofactor E-like protein-like n=1 Tax=Saccoglossus kowalevskii TaxID=10224 RepID=A0ABM0MI88_SACKO|nr:PREDICTED: tubulin-specific chaperone cofactor E-like protein-like [Saccoglossus kowalevskii]
MAANTSSSSSSSAGISLPEALRAKYTDSTAEQYEHIFISGQGTKAAPGSLFIPTCLTLNDCGISTAGNAGEIEQLCTGVKELDLTLNNLHCWKEEEIFYSNPLTHSIPSDLLDSVSLATIKRLVLNNTHAPWDAVHQLLSNMPSLEEVLLSLNDFVTVSSPDNPYTSIKMCQFNSNGVTDFAEVCKLGKMFPMMENLYLAENKFSDLSGEVAECFPQLKSLSIRDNAIDSWESIDKLKEFPHLCDVRMKGLPLAKTILENERRPLLVARLPKIVRLNGSPILDEEREDAERIYHELVDIYGKLDPLAEVDLSPPEVAQCLVKFRDEQKLMNINLTQTVSELKKHLRDFVGLPPSKFLLDYLDPECPQGSTEMKSNNRRLYAYKMKDGDEIHIFKKGFFLE